jgi:hypothetical protein
MEETWTVATPEGAVTVRHYDPTFDLLLGLYTASLITNPPRTRYSYRPLSMGSALDLSWLSQIPPKYNYLPPPSTLSPVYKSLWIQSEIESELRDYEYKLKSIHEMEMFQMKLDVQGLIDDLKREMERVKKD